MDATAMWERAKRLALVTPYPARDWMTVLPMSGEWWTDDELLRLVNHVAAHGRRMDILAIYLRVASGADGDGSTPA